MKEFVDDLRKRRHVTVYPGIAERELDRFHERVGWILPDDHQAFLRETNGLLAFEGYERVFGLYCKDPIDATAWNERDTWKFAWNVRLDDFWCFAEDVWGSQFAYRIGDLRTGASTKVYHIGHADMDAAVIRDSFTDFANASFPRDESVQSDLRLAREHSRPLKASEHLMFAPPFWLAPGDMMQMMDRLSVMNARTAMVFNGDAKSIVDTDETPGDWTLASIQPFVDKKKRARLSVVWRTPDGDLVRALPLDCRSRNDDSK